MRSVLFVCLGNICRSPIAEGVAKRYALKHSHELTIDSAGTSSWHIGQPPCSNSIKVAKLHGIDISTFRGRQVTTKDFSTFDLIVALDQSNYNNLKALGCTNLVKLGAFGFNNEDVPDPFFFDGFDGFETVYSMIEESVHSLLKQKLTL